MTQDEVVADIKKLGWNTIRWGWPVFSRHVVETLIDFEKSKAPEYFLIGKDAAHAMQMTRTKMFERVPGAGPCIGKLMGFPLYVRQDIPTDVIALVSPTMRIGIGKDWEMISHSASWIKTGERK